MRGVPSSDRPQSFLFLAGAVAMTVLAFTELPPLPDLLHAPATPYDHNPSVAMATEWRLVADAATVIPFGVSVSAIAEPRNATVETALHRDAVALLPGRRIIPAAFFAVPTHSEDDADYWIIAGPAPASPPRGERVLSTPLGTVWRRTVR